VTKAQTASRAKAEDQALTVEARPTVSARDQTFLTANPAAVTAGPEKASTPTRAQPSRRPGCSIAAPMPTHTHGAAAQVRPAASPGPNQARRRHAEPPGRRLPPSKRAGPAGRNTGRPGRRSGSGLNHREGTQGEVNRRPAPRKKIVTQGRHLQQPAGDRSACSRASRGPACCAQAASPPGPTIIWARKKHCRS